MESPLISVIIPAYNGGDHLANAIQSVLVQTYPHFELIVVDDVSSDPVEQAISKFDDSRLKFFRQKENQGAVAARKTGLGKSSGEIIAFLDQDDWFHPEKLKAHVSFLHQHPDIDVTYNSRFEFNEGSQAIRSIWEPPQSASLADLVLGFPFSPSDTVLRRDAALREEIWDQSYVRNDGERIFNGGEIVFGGRLALSGHKFAHVGKALNYRRYHPRRVYKGLVSRCDAERTCQEMILDDPRCPENVQALRPQALRNTYLVWTYYAFAQGETAVGQEFLREAVRLDPAVIEDQPCKLVNFWVLYTAMDWGVDIEKHLGKLFSQLPSEMSHVFTQLDWAIARGFLRRGTQTIFWDDKEQGHALINRALELGSNIDDDYIQDVTFQLMAFQGEFGERAGETILQNLSKAMKWNGSRADHLLTGTYRINQAHKSFQVGEFTNVPVKVFEAIRHNPRYLMNRGALAILFRSALRLRSSFQSKPE